MKLTCGSRRWTVTFGGKRAFPSDGGSLLCCKRPSFCDGAHLAIIFRMEYHRRYLSRSLSHSFGHTSPTHFLTAACQTPHPPCLLIVLFLNQRKKCITIYQLVVRFDVLDNVEPLSRRKIGYITHYGLRTPIRTGERSRSYVKLD